MNLIGGLDTAFSLIPNLPQLQLLKVIKNWRQRRPGNKAILDNRVVKITEAK